jgi:hypothetical protein
MARAWRLWDILGPALESPEPEEGQLTNPDPRCRGYLRRLECRDRVIRSLLRGRLQLLEAAALFRALAHEPPEFCWEAFRSVHPGSTDDERFCWQVIAFARAVLSDNPGQADEVLTQLDAELREHLCRGPFRLPDPATSRFSGLLPEEHPRPSNREHVAPIGGNGREGQPRGNQHLRGHRPGSAND